MTIHRIIRHQRRSCDDYNAIFIFFFVDNIAPLCTIHREKVLEDLLDKLKKFKLTYLGEMKWFLDVRVIRETD